MRVGIVLLAWQRLHGIYQNLKDLDSQTVEGFKIVISNANRTLDEKIKEYVVDFPELDVDIRNESNDYLTFRRFFIAREMAMDGFDIIMFIDDDILIPNNYVELAIAQYEPGIYGSAYTWTLDAKGADYYKHRTRVYDNDSQIKYCGAGISVIDAKIFLQDELFMAPAEAYGIDDLWLSYYADHVAKFKLKYINIPKVIIGGGDSVALYRSISRQQYTKKNFLHHLVGLGWQV
jgi:hypothetical protein